MGKVTCPIQKITTETVSYFAVWLCGVGDGRRGQQQQLGKKWKTSTARFHDWVAVQSTCCWKVLNYLSLIACFTLNVILVMKYITDESK